MAHEEITPDGELVHAQQYGSGLATLNRGEVEMQLDAAHKYPRSIAAFRSEATSLATLSKEVASACIYALPRGGKTLTGPSVRLAEICASAYGNLQYGARVVDVTDTEVVAQGVAWDMQKNVRVTIEARRRITDKSGKRFNDDMITMTGSAAMSIALRNAVFRVVPRAYIDLVYVKAKETAVGDAKTLSTRRIEVVSYLEKMGGGIPRERIMARIGKRGIDDVDLEALEVLIGLGTAIKGGDMTPDEAFPPIVESVIPTTPAEEGRRVSLRGDSKPKDAPPSQPTAPVAHPTREPGEEG